MTNQLKIIRDNDLRTIWDRIRLSGVNIQMLPRNKVIELIANYEAPRFYITEKMAERYICALLKGHTIVSTPAKKRMVEDLFEVYKKIVTENPLKQKYTVWNELVNHPAKEFYVGRQTIENAIFRRRKTN